VIHVASTVRRSRSFEESSIGSASWSSILMFVNVLALVRAKISQPRVLCVQTCIFVIKLRILALVGFLIIRVGVSVD